MILEDRTLTVKIKFTGSFRALSGKREIELRVKESSPLKEIIRSIVKRIPGLTHVLIDSNCESPKTNMLVLVNGKEISVLHRFETLVKDGDEIVFVPVVHGG
jgi:MoaD family protein